VFRQSPGAPDLQQPRVDSAAVCGGLAVPGLQGLDTARQRQLRRNVSGVAPLYAQLSGPSQRPGCLGKHAANCRRKHTRRHLRSGVSGGLAPAHRQDHGDQGSGPRLGQILMAAIRALDRRDGSGICRRCGNADEFDGSPERPSNSGAISSAPASSAALFHRISARAWSWCRCSIRMRKP